MPPTRAISSVFPATQKALSRLRSRVADLIADQLTSSIPEVEELCRYVERYRGKMVRPALTALSAAAATGRTVEEACVDDVVTVASVVELIHLATLVHDDVLDDAETRRGAPTIARIRGSETAVILGDFLISKSFHLCSTLDSQTTALRIGEITSAVCEGEMLQLARRGDAGLDEESYYAIITRKTAALIAVACELGAWHAGASDQVCREFFNFGIDLGVAFQIQDDLLDLVGAEDVVGKPLGKDIEKGKLTLPLLHHLRVVDGPERERVITLIRSETPLNGQRAPLAARLHATGSVDYAINAAESRIAQAKAHLAKLPPSAARDQLSALADAALHRDR
jgi:octaprenyl-diphosphate synthase